MKYQAHARLVAAALGAALAIGVTAQTRPDSDPPPTPPGQVMSDVAPLPAEERSSTGAIVLQDSLVRAQRNNAFHAAGQRTGVTSVGRNATRVLTEAEAEAGLAARDADANDTRRMGAGGLIKQ